MTRRLLSALMFSSVTAWAGGVAAVEVDTLIENATVYDGTLAAPRIASIGIQRDRIVAIGSFQADGHPRRIDGTGLIAAPGFIDLHNHSDLGDSETQTEVPIVEPGTLVNANYLYQGVTTIVTGNCGGGQVDVGGYLRHVGTAVPGTNVAHLVPFNEVRQRVMGNENRAPRADELARMKTLVARGMEDGAWGMSTGLYYTPASYAKTDEVVELSKVVARFNGLYASHMRDEGVNLLRSIEETLQIAREAQLPVHISHIKVDRPVLWGTSEQAIAMIVAAQARGLRVTADQYPYRASCTSLQAEAIPPEYLEGTHQDLVKRFDDPEIAGKMRAGMNAILNEYEGGKTIHLGNYKKNPSWQGIDLVSLSRQNKLSVTDLIFEVERNGGASSINFCMGEKDVESFMKQPFVATASDGHTALPSHPEHPRSYGTFPRKLGEYAIRKHTLSLVQAIRSASGLPADILRMTDRGYLKTGNFADIVLFDPKRLRDLATFEKPNQYSVGVEYLWVNGVLSIDAGRLTAKRGGRPLVHAARSN